MPMSTTATPVNVQLARVLGICSLMSRTDSPAKRDPFWRSRRGLSPNQTYSTYAQLLRAFTAKQAYGF
nr:hypothetical protein [Nostoc sp. SerVER01]